jgi:hypothetical protein
MDIHLFQRTFPSDVLVYKPILLTVFKVYNRKSYSLSQLHRKKSFASFLSPARMSLPNSPWVGIMTSYKNYSCPGRVWQWHPCWDGKQAKIFLQCRLPGIAYAGGFLNFVVALLKVYIKGLYLNYLKGVCVLTRDFQLQVFFMNQFPLDPWVSQ